MEELGVSESAIEIVKKATFNRLGLISFFTVGKDEVKAWPIKKVLQHRKLPGRFIRISKKGLLKHKSYILTILKIIPILAF